MKIVISLKEEEEEEYNLKKSEAMAPSNGHWKRKMIFYRILVQINIRFMREMNFTMKIKRMNEIK